MTALGAAYGELKDELQQHAKVRDVLEAQLADEQRLREGVEQQRAALDVHLADERRVREGVEQQREALDTQLADERRVREGVEQQREALDTQLADERRAREGVEQRLEAEQQAHHGTLESLAELKQSAAAQDEAIAEASRKCTDFEERIHTLHTALEQVKQELQHHAALRQALEAELESERAARTAAEAHAVTLAETHQHADEQFHAGAQEMVGEALRARETEANALAHARAQCEQLAAQLKEAVSALGVIDDAAQAHAAANARLEAHLKQHAAAAAASHAAAAEGLTERNP